MRSFWLLLGLALIAAGFVTRRLMVPRLASYLIHRRVQPAVSGSESVGHSPAVDGPKQSAEGITEGDRRALDEVIRQKSR